MLIDRGDACGCALGAPPASTRAMRAARACVRSTHGPPAAALQAAAAAEVHSSTVQLDAMSGDMMSCMAMYICPASSTHICIIMTYETHVYMYGTDVGTVLVLYYYST